MRIRALCIDPGTTESGYVVYNGERVSSQNSGIKNEDMIDRIKGEGKYEIAFPVDIIIIEMISSYGMAVGESTFETCVWIGRFIEAFYDPEKAHRVYRRDIKMHLCNTMRAKDTNIRQAVLDKFPAIGGGKTPQIGTKKQPGPLYGITGHAMSALALGITYFELEELKAEGKN